MKTIFCTIGQHPKVSWGLVAINMLALLAAVTVFFDKPIGIFIVLLPPFITSFLMSWWLSEKRVRYSVLTGFLISMFNGSLLAIFYSYQGAYKAWEFMPIVLTLGTLISVVGSGAAVFLDFRHHNPPD